MSSVPSGHPLRFFLGARVFLCGKLLTWRIRQVGSKKSPRVRGGFFSVLVSWGIVGWVYVVSSMWFFSAYFLLSVLYWSFFDKIYFLVNRFIY